MESGVRFLMQRVNVAWLWCWIALYGGSLTVLSAYIASGLTSDALQFFRESR